MSPRLWAANMISLILSAPMHMITTAKNWKKYFVTLQYIHILFQFNSLFERTKWKKYCKRTLRFNIRLNITSSMILYPWIWYAQPCKGGQHHSVAALQRCQTCGTGLKLFIECSPVLFSLMTGLLWVGYCILLEWMNEMQTPGRCHQHRDTSMWDWQSGKSVDWWLITSGWFWYWSR